jgi:hypothetical protein
MPVLMRQKRLCQLIKQAMRPIRRSALCVGQ